MAGTRTFEVDFDKNLVKQLDVKYKIEKTPRRRAEVSCHVFKVKEDMKKISSSVQLTPGKKERLPWLYGPATNLETKTIIYPCSRYMCSLPCPCLICNKIHPKCRVRAVEGCNCMDCQKQLFDHSSFHGCFHVGCKYCFSLVKNIPNFNFVFLNKPYNANPIGGSTDYIPHKPLVTNPKPKTPRDRLGLPLDRKKLKDMGGVECIYCGRFQWSIAQHKEHISLNHIVSKIFRHNHKSVRKTSPKEHKCYQCLLCYKSSTELNRHVDSVHYEESYDCEICDKTFTRKGNLTKHRRVCNIVEIVNVNAQEVPITFECDVCPKRFKRKDNLLRHSR